MHLVLDACVALDWFLPSEAGASYSQPLAKATASGNARFHVPAHFDVEVCGQLLKSHRRKPDTFSKKWLDTSLETLDMRGTWCSGRPASAPPAPGFPVIPISSARRERLTT